MYESNENGNAAGGPALRAKLESGGPVLGTWVNINHEQVIETLDAVGYDFVGIDCQHGPISEGDAVGLVRRARGARSAFVVRVSANTPALIGKVLDAGADGVIVPLVNNAEEARAAVASCLYPPNGHRSFGPMRGDLPRVPAELGGRVSCFVMIETEEGIANAAEICAVPGVAGIVVGPGDLSIGLGMDPMKGFTTDQLREPLSRIREACEAAGVTFGIFAGDASSTEKWVAQGIRLLIVSVDAGLLAGAAAGALETARAGASAAAV
jgi:4-hydroxy-2-oxoheptanedioate aldolase